MKRLIYVTLLFVPLAFAQTPTQIGGFKLNTDIEQYKHLLKTETIQSIRFMEAVEEAEIQRIPGFRSGYIAYGTCASPGKVVRIKLKYRDSSERFYKKLLESYTDRFGKAKWLGDVFHVVSTWKWVFTDKTNQIELYLQHNLSDKSQKLGNSVKLTMLNLIQEERDCFENSNPDFRNSKKQSEGEYIVDWEDLLPR